jgi:hypothetical protein
VPNFHYFHPDDNVAPDATVTTSGTANSAYPLANATDLSYANLAAPSLLEETSGAWVLDFGTAQRIDAVLVWHNLAEGTGYAIQLNATNSWATPTVNVASTAPAKRADGYTVKIYKDLTTGVTGYSTGGFRYLRFNVSGTNSAPVGIKILAFSRIRTTLRNISWGLQFQEHQTNIDMTTDALVPWASDLAAAPRQLIANIMAKNADATALKEWFRACGGRAKVTAMVPDPSAPDPLLGRHGDGSIGVVAPGLKVLRQDDTWDFTNVHRMRVVIDEVTAGDPEWT